MVGIVVRTDGKAVVVPKDRNPEDVVGWNRVGGDLLLGAYVCHAIFPDHLSRAQ